MAQICAQQRLTAHAPTAPVFVPRDAVGEISMEAAGGRLGAWPVTLAPSGPPAVFAASRSR